MLVNRLLIGILVLSALTSCKKSLGKDEYVNWVRDPENGFHKSKTIGELNIDVLYKPLDYAVLEQLRDSANHPTAFNRKSKDLENMVYFDLEVSLKNGDIAETKAASAEELQQVMYYLSFDLAKDITLTTSQDTATCELFHFLRTYKIGNKRKFLLGLPKKKSFDSEDLTLNIDSDLFAVGAIKVTFSKKDINSLPILKI